MNPVNPVFAVLSLTLALASAFLIGRVVGFPKPQGRFASLDGLRGLLAFFVFLHHAAYWYYYLRTSVWNPPPSHLYEHFGTSSVRLFFMVTGFLFFSKILDANTRPIDWTRLYVSRVLRLVPLYLAVVGVMLLCVLIVSRFTLRDPIDQLLHQLFEWVTFTIFGNPDVNQVKHTLVMVAGVTWSLPFEWFFYFSLPVLAFVYRRKVPLTWLMFSALLVGTALYIKPQLVLASSFAGGMLSAYLVRQESVRKIAQTKLASAAVLGCLTYLVIHYEHGWGMGPLLLLSAVFAAIACGNDVFGTLTSRAARLLGEISYSIYLLHGLVLYITFEFVIGANAAANLAVEKYWAVIGVCTPVLVLCSYASYRFIEAVPMQSVDRVMTLLRAGKARVFANAQP